MYLSRNICKYFHRLKFVDTIWKNSAIFVLHCSKIIRLPCSCLFLTGISSVVQPWRQTVSRISRGPRPMGVHHREQAPAPLLWIPCLCMKDRQSRWVACVLQTLSDDCTCSSSQCENANCDMTKWHEWSLCLCVLCVCSLWFICEREPRQRGID